MPPEAILNQWHIEIVGIFQFLHLFPYSPSPWMKQHNSRFYTSSQVVPNRIEGPLTKVKALALHIADTNWITDTTCVVP